MKVAITGAGGQLGRCLSRVFGDAAMPLARTELDICQPDAAERLHSLRPDVLINCAAYTRVDQAELEPQDCQATNATAVQRLAGACERHGIDLVQISTDYVFGGDAQRRVPYRETDPTAPQSIYAESKRLGEQYAQLHPRHLIVRTCGLYELGSQNFVTRILELARGGRPLSVVDDQQCCPSNANDVAESIHYLVHQGAQGIYHVVNQGSATWFELAREVLQRAGIRATIHPIHTADYGARAARPQYSVLDTQKYAQLGGPSLRSWREALDALQL